jgi:hypothetical protein
MRTEVALFAEAAQLHSETPLPPGGGVITRVRHAHIVNHRLQKCRIFEIQSLIDSVLDRTEYSTASGQLHTDRRS